MPDLSRLSAKRCCVGLSAQGSYTISTSLSLYPFLSMVGASVSPSLGDLFSGVAVRQRAGSDSERAVSNQGFRQMVCGWVQGWMLLQWQGDVRHILRTIVLQHDCVPNFDMRLQMHLPLSLQQVH